MLPDFFVPELLLDYSISDSPEWIRNAASQLYDSSSDRIKALHPEAKVLWMSGYMDERIRRERLLEHGEAFLPKPFDADGLARKVRDVLDDDPPR